MRDGKPKEIKASVQGVVCAPEPRAAGFHQEKGPGGW